MCKKKANDEYQKQTYFFKFKYLYFCVKTYFVDRSAFRNISPTYSTCRPTRILQVGK